VTHPIDTGNLEAERSTGVIRSVEIIAHHEDDIEQLLEELGVSQVVASSCQQIQALTSQYWRIEKG